MKKILDVSALEAPDPLDLSLAAAQELSVGDYLHIFHRMEPKLLFPLLEAGGYAWDTRFNADGFNIYVWRVGDLKAEALVKKLQS